MALILALLAGCGRDEVSVVRNSDTLADTRTTTRAAIDRYVAAGKTAAAFAALAAALDEVRDSDDLRQTHDAELRLLALALPLEVAVQHLAIDAQADRLALTLWPALLDEPLTAAKNLELAPRPEEAPAQYVDRLCATTLSSQCGDTAADLRANAVHAIAIRHADARMRAALTSQNTNPDHAWSEISWKWDHLARDGSTTSRSTARVAAKPHATAPPIAAL